MNRIVTYILFSLLILGCKSTGEKPVKVSKSAPHWVTSIPTHPEYYIGVFSVNKIGTDYRQKAQKGALENLASEISVVISGESVLKTLETNSSFDQEYKQEVVIKSTEDIEGYELVDAWESDYEYWVYYRLSKSKYAQIKKERINKALNIGKDFFARAKTNHDNNNYHEAFVLSIKALESVSKYLDEPLKTDINGEEVYFATEVMSYTQEMVNEIQILPGAPEYDFLLGDNIGEDKVFFLVKNQNGQLINQVPLNCEYKAVFFKNYKVVSNAEGRAGISIGKINQSTKEQFITAKLDFDKLASNQTRDKIVLKLLDYLPAKSGKIKLNVRAPKIYVESREKEFGKSIAPKMVPTAKQVLTSRGFTVVSSKKDADLVMLIKAESKLVGQNKNTFQVSLNGNVEVKKTNGNEIVFSEIFQPTKGLQLSKERASSDAYAKAESYLKRRVIPKLANLYFAF